MKISVIIPVYNAADTLQRCMDSIVAQDFTDYELIVVDNNSTDSSRQICNSYGQESTRIAVCQCYQQGVSAARNMGIKKAVGEYLFFIDADDYLAPGFLRKAAEYMQEDGCDWIVPVKITLSGKPSGRDSSSWLESARSFSEERRRLHSRPEIFRAFYEFLPQYTFHDVFKMYRRDLVEAHAVSFDVKASLGEDLLFNLAYMHVAMNCVLEGDMKYYYVVNNPESLNFKFRKDVAAIKQQLQQEIKKVIREYDLGAADKWQNYFLIYLNDLYQCLCNIFADPDYREESARRQLNRLLEQEDTQLLFHCRFEKKLKLHKKVFLGLLKCKDFKLLGFVIKVLFMPRIDI